MRRHDRSAMSPKAQKKHLLLKGNQKIHQRCRLGKEPSFKLKGNGCIPISYGKNTVHTASSHTHIETWYFRTLIIN